MMKKILIVDDEKNVRDSIGLILSNTYEPLYAASGEEAIKIYQDEKPYLVLLDIIMPNTDGLQVLERLKEIDRSAVVIMVTAVTVLSTAIEAMRKGAYDYIQKPFNADELKVKVNKAVTAKDMVNEIKFLRSEISRKYDFENIVGNSKAIQDIFAKIKQIADSKTTVLITGESGTGKELIAKSIYYHSSRNNKPFIAINCAAIPDTLIESELFGHEKGAFTDASARRAGQFELANEGTLFLDEIGDLSLATQAKILRVLQEREFLRVGGVKTIKVDVRLIAATNKDLEKATREGRFREDLFYRINVIPIYLPPLRERKDDIPLLIDYFINKKSIDGRKRKFSQEAMDIMLNYHWPGNIRELENVIERVITLTPDNIIKIVDLPQNITNETKAGLMKDDILSGRLSLEEAISSFEKEIILTALEKTNYVQTQAANLLGISRRILKYKMDNLNILTEREKKE
ncbi:MAG: Fis family transcriptional regulator [Nitrospirae bacterium RBG_19FT_COMBO_42_15]|nr:MAG: Fis family transcriptional regulator [Nitrospirae bacterium RBG_19FT_COMBO_42_15]